MMFISQKIIRIMLAMPSSILKVVKIVDSKNFNYKGKQFLFNLRENIFSFETI